MEKWRLFIGVLLPEPTRAAIGPAQQALREQKLAVRWVRPENWHITLHFLGDIDSAVVPGLSVRLAAELAGLAAPMLRCQALGAFPNQRSPRVLWAGIAGDVDRLGLIQAGAVAAGETVGVAAEKRPYHPHITLGYVRDQASPAERAECGAALDRVTWAGDSERPYPTVALIRSVLSREGAVYTPLWQVDLTPA